MSRPGKSRLRSRDGMKGPLRGRGQGWMGLRFPCHVREEESRAKQITVLVVLAGMVQAHWPAPPKRHGREVFCALTVASCVGARSRQRLVAPTYLRNLACLGK
jgi:hypothetical protein